MTPQVPTPEAEGLYAYLHGRRPASDPEVPPEEAKMAAALRSLAQEIQPAPGFQIDLQARLSRKQRAMHSAARSTNWQAGRAAAWVVLAILVVAALGWAIRNLVPQPLLSASQSPTPAGAGPLTPTAGSSQIETAQPTESLPQPVEPDTPTPTPETPTYSSPQLPGAALGLQASFPDSPSDAMLYIQTPGEALTLDAARQVAAQLGIQGHVYLLPGGAPGTTNYVASDGKSMLYIYNTPRHFFYTADMSREATRISRQVPGDAEIATAESFLKQHGLLDFPYRISVPAYQTGTIDFLPLLENHAILYSVLDAAKIEVQMDDQGQVKSIDYYRPSFQEVSRFPIRTAQQAWEKILAEGVISGLESASRGPDPAAPQTWEREYPLDQPVEVFGYFNILQPAEPDVQPLVTFNDYPVAGDIQGISRSVQPGQLVRVSGRFMTGKDGRRTLQIESWQAISLPYETLDGTIQHRGDQAFLVTPDRDLLLPGLTDDVPDGLQVNVGGWIQEQPTPILNWSIIIEGPSSLGGGGGGGPTFAELNLSGEPVADSTPILTPTPLPTPAGLVEGARGSVQITTYQYTDGVSKTEVNLAIQPTEAWPDGLYVRLKGDGLEGIEKYHLLPVRVWGTFGEMEGDMPVLLVERYEPVYPGVQVQAWLGKLDAVSLEGKDVLRLTTQDGKQYVLATYFDPNAGQGQPSGDIVVEGATFPGQTLGGYPVITDFATFLDEGRTDLNGYIVQSASPFLIRKSFPSTGPGRAIVEEIELVYTTLDLRFRPEIPDASLLYAQPVWRFAGHYEDGRAFEILVQALADRYLK